MGISAWDCPVCHKDTPLDHYETSLCGETISEDYAAAVLDSERSHYRHGKREIGTTDLLGCPRKAAIVADVDYAVDPTSLNAPLTGTAWHERLAKSGANREIPVEGVIDGRRVVTSIDKVRKAGTGLVIEDDKHQNDYGARKLKDGPKPEHVVQLVIGAELYWQTHGKRIDRGIIRAHFTSKPGNVAQHVNPLPALEEVLGMKPLGGTGTVRDHLMTLGRWQDGALAWQDMALYGEFMSYGDKSACDYCPVRRPCKEAAYGADF